MKKTAVYAGSFDPITIGHKDIVERALKIFDEVTLLIAISPSKKPLFSTEQRVTLLKETFADEPRVKSDSWQGLLVGYVKQNNIGAIVRGLRPTGDFEIEFQMASMNRKLLPEAETVFLMTGENTYYVSSSLVKEVYSHGGDVSEFVPKNILEALKSKKD